ncbi:hypothetical protein B7R21_11615 [Subtercola boreus]|uniref:Uncharacterized protein n=1 Tax=Subtercola boreus TaxID=120213 RepID=A0A3E0VPN5_9MICO|nr:hypothetical protein [Subtercola boreus]RFA11974.1 hypothetical protein B7R21_11615 [Subtercola boreus]
MSSFIQHCNYCDRPFQAQRSTARFCSGAHRNDYRRRATDAWREEAVAVLIDQQLAAIAVNAEALGAVIRRADELFAPSRRRSAA